MQELIAGLRIDVDTLRGTRSGIPNLLQTLARHNIKATFFFSVGPDNMGRHLRRLLRPAFLVKMLRTKAATLYGWEILLRGVLWRGPVIGSKCKDIIRRAAEEGHEIGLHCWDHYQWQVHIDSMSTRAIRTGLEQGKCMLEELIGRSVLCSAAPGWRCTDRVLTIKESLGFVYNSDCRGTSLFYPETGGGQRTQPQIPVTLPTYDELIGRDGVTGDLYNERLLSLFKPDGLNVLTVHAEVEGICCHGIFKDFLDKAESRGIRLRPLIDLLENQEVRAKTGIIRSTIEGREGWISCQAGEGINLS